MSDDCADLYIENMETPMISYTKEEYTPTDSTEQELSRRMLELRLSHMNELERPVFICRNPEPDRIPDITLPKPLKHIFLFGFIIITIFLFLIAINYLAVVFINSL